MHPSRAGIALFPLKFEECEVIQGEPREKVPSQSLFSQARDKHNKSYGGDSLPAFFFSFTDLGRTNYTFKVTAERTYLTPEFIDVLKGQFTPNWGGGVSVTIRFQCICLQFYTCEW